MKENTLKFSIDPTGPTFAAPLIEETEQRAKTNEVDQRMLLFRLSDAASRIRDESNLIRRTGFTDASSRLLRILGETVEEQRLALSKVTK